MSDLAKRLLTARAGLQARIAALRTRLRSRRTRDLEPPPAGAGETTETEVLEVLRRMGAVLTWIDERLARIEAHLPKGNDAP